MESKCYDCINYMKRHELGSINRECVLSHAVHLDVVVDCSHFKPKKRESLQHKQPQIEALKDAGQTTEKDELYIA